MEKGTDNRKGPKTDKFDLQVFSVLSAGGAQSIWSAKQLAASVHASEERVRRAIKRLRQRYQANDKAVPSYVYLTASGYTLKETDDSAVYEATFRYRMAVGVLANGAHVFDRANSCSAFADLKARYKPKTLKILKVFK